MRTWSLALLAVALAGAHFADATNAVAVAPSATLRDPGAAPPHPAAVPRLPVASSGLTVEAAPVPVLIDAEGRAVAPAKCNVGTPSSGNVPGIQFCCPTTTTPM